MARVKRWGNRLWYGLALMLISCCSLIGRTPPVWAAELKASERARAFHEKLYAQAAPQKSSKVQDVQKGLILTPQSPASAAPKAAAYAASQPTSAALKATVSVASQPKAVPRAPVPPDVEELVTAQGAQRASEIEQRLNRGEQLETGELALMEGRINQDRLQTISLQLNLILERLGALDEKTEGRK